MVFFSTALSLHVPTTHRWAIVLPVAFLPLAVVLFLNQRKAKRQGTFPISEYHGLPAAQAAKKLWFDLDVPGLLLLAAAICLILIPLTLASRAKGGWANGSIIAMLVIGVVCLAVFPFWEGSKRLAPHAFFPRSLFANKTVVAGVAIGFFYFSSSLSLSLWERSALTYIPAVAFYLSIFPYFSSYLYVVQGKSVTAAGHITQTFSFSATVSSIIISFVIKYTAHYKYFVTLGAGIYLMGMGLMMHYRQPGVSTGTLVGCQLAVGLGGGMLNVPAQLGVQAASSHQNVAAATAAFLTFVEIGGAVGGAISGAVWSHFVPKKLGQYLPPSIADQASSIYGNVSLASTGWDFGTPERDAIIRAYQETMTILLTIAVCVCAPIVPLSMVMKNYRLDRMDQHVKGTVIGGKGQGGGDHVEGSPETMEREN
jgi:hypothetical protein